MKTLSRTHKNPMSTAFAHPTAPGGGTGKPARDAVFRNQDVMTEIFRWLALDHSQDWCWKRERVLEERGDPGRVYGWLSILRVSKNWYDIAMKAPTLWNNIKLLPHTGHIIDTFAKRSHPLPLRIEGAMLSDYFEDEDFFKDWTNVFRYSDRIRELVLYVDWFAFEFGGLVTGPGGVTFHEDGMFLSWGYPDLSNLETLEYHSEERCRHAVSHEFPFPPFLQHLGVPPRLRSISMNNVALRSFTYLLTERMQHLVFIEDHPGENDATLDELCDALSQCPNLRTLTLGPILEGLEVSSNVQSQVGPLAHRNVPLRLLEFLEIKNQTALQSAYLLAAIDCPRGVPFRLCVADSDPESPDRELAALVNAVLPHLSSTKPFRALLVVIEHTTGGRPETTITAWYSPHSKLVHRALGERCVFDSDHPMSELPPLSITLVGFSPSMVLGFILPRLPLSQVETLCVETSIDTLPVAPLPTPQMWHEWFSHMQNVEALVVEAQATRYIPAALLGHLSGSRDRLFPKLRKMCAHDIYLGYGESPGSMDQDWERPWLTSISAAIRERPVLRASFGECHWHYGDDDEGGEELMEGMRDEVDMEE